MKLKQIKIFGFKTFADKTELDLDGNILAVVGPNGCGKSNIVDSILWGLGETNARSLRAQTAKEVIFSGSGRRKPLGFAEVTLLFDNEDGMLPIDSAEVAVTRKLTRAGDSSYQINKRNCRLRDVNDLLADSGMGRAGYAIVSQSEIDQALAASAVQRRAWIDEAAGVQRYRARRNESMRRLDAAKFNLERLHDLLNEIDTQRGPLAEEAETAKRYKSVLSGLREVETGLLINDLTDALQELDELETRIAEAMQLAEKEAERGVQSELKAEEASAEVIKTEAVIEALREEQSSAQAAVEHAQASLKVARHKLESLDELEASLNAETEISADRKAEAEAEVVQSKQEEAVEIERRDALRTELSGVGGIAEALRQRLATAEQTLASARKQLVAQQKSEVEAAHRDERRKQVRRELKGIAETLPDLEAGVAEAQQVYDGHLTQLKEAKDAVASADTELRALDQAVRSAAERSRELLGKLAVLEGRHRGLLATLDAHEGLAHGTRAVLDAVASGRLQADYVPVAETIDVDPDLAQAFDIALGAAGNDLIVDNEQAAKQAIAFLKSERAGRATFQPLTLMRSPNAGHDLQNLVRERGVVGVASTLVRCDAKYRPVIESLLGRVVIVESLDDALRLAKTRGWNRMVTVDGEIVHSSGAVTGGASHRQGNGVVQRKAELAQLEEQIAELQQAIQKCESADSTDNDERSAIEQRRVAALELQEATAQEAEDARVWLMSLKHEATTTEASKKRLEAELAALLPLEASEGATSLPIDQLEQERDALLQELAAKSHDASTAKERLREADERVAQAQRRRSEAERRLHNLKETEELRSKRAVNLGPEREKCLVTMRESALEAEHHEKEVVRLRAATVEATERKKTLTEQVAAFQEEARAAQKSATAVASVLHQSELKRARAESRRATSAQRLIEEYGVSEAEALEKKGTIEVPDDAPALVSRLRKELKAMGEVNLGAVDAYERLTERYDELNGQVTDVTESMTEIESTIAELDTKTRERFMDTFDKLKVAFGEIFTKMFGGGEGSLDLTEADNVLDTGVEIAVTIPGKRRQRLELLSGGERAMSALAFLFALLKVKPSPLVVLDEVDAPLDGRNVERFIAMLREFNDQTQFILITHNNVTIESADVWFGVTMQEPGVTTVVPYRVTAGRVTSAAGYTA